MYKSMPILFPQNICTFKLFQLTFLFHIHYRLIANLNQLCTFNMQGKIFKCILFRHSSPKKKQVLSDTKVPLD